jgi:1-aminocyclopropane-1-carboxylate deaminase/D-cysteine desulfhydrase-like pyridoxal-dependent ACC family enzyme
VGDPVREVTAQIASIWRAATERWGGAIPEPNWQIIDDYIGRGYALTTDEELAVQAEATRLTGMIFDPAYTGKAIYGLRREIESGRFGAEDHVVFWHTGGGFSAFAHDWDAVLT